MKLLPVSSSRMQAVGWENNSMYILFNNGALYEYLNVSKIEYTNFISSSSLGKELNVFQRLHSYRRVR